MGVLPEIFKESGVGEGFVGDVSLASPDQPTEDLAEIGESGRQPGESPGSKSGESE